MEARDKTILSNMAEWILENAGAETLIKLGFNRNDFIKYLDFMEDDFKHFKIEFN